VLLAIAEMRVAAVTGFDSSCYIYLLFVCVCACVCCNIETCARQTDRLAAAILPY
jgi:hypothetical protein